MCVFYFKGNRLKNVCVLVGQNLWKGISRKLKKEQVTDGAMKGSSPRLLYLAWVPTLPHPQSSDSRAVARGSKHFWHQCSALSREKHELSFPTPIHLTHSICFIGNRSGWNAFNMQRRVRKDLAWPAKNTAKDTNLG